jgi:hypothetical protein
MHRTSVVSPSGVPPRLDLSDLLEAADPAGDPPDDLDLSDLLDPGDFAGDSPDFLDLFDLLEAGDFAGDVHGLKSVVWFFWENGRLAIRRENSSTNCPAGISRQELPGRNFPAGIAWQALPGRNCPAGMASSGVSVGVQSPPLLGKCRSLVPHRARVSVGV